MDGGECSYWNRKRDESIDTKSLAGWLREDRILVDCKAASLDRTAVINLSARRTIWYAARRSTSLVEDPSTGYAVYTKEDDGFYAILGSTNGASSMRLLIDHKAELGNRTVERIVVVGGLPGTRNGVALDLRDDFTRSRSFFLVLSERRTEE
jgi:hypothetical protein